VPTQHTCLWDDGPGRNSQTTSQYMRKESEHTATHLTVFALPGQARRARAGKRVGMLKQCSVSIQA
jgi:hypothetical protein